MATVKLPEDIDAERALLSTLAAHGTLDPGSENADAHRAILGLRPEHLSHPGHRMVLDAIQTLYRDAEPINSLALKALLESRGQLDRLGGYSTLVDMLSGDEVGRPSSLVGRILDLWRQRRVVALGRSAMDRAVGLEPVGEVISSIAAELTALAAGNASIRIRPGTTLQDKILAGEPFRDRERGARLARFGIQVLDDALECSAGHVVTIGARPGVGKSALGVQAVWKTARAGKSALLVSLEMDEDEIDCRMAAWASGEGYKVWRDGRWSAASAEHLLQEQAVGHWMTWCHASGIPWAKVEAGIRDAVRLHGVSVVVLDHALLVAKPDLGRGASDAAAWSTLSRGIKRLAGELRICFVVLIQLNRAGAEGEPKLSDLKESGAWEEDANAVLLLWQKDPGAEEQFQAKRRIWVKVAKNRSGTSNWKRELEFTGALNRFAQVDRDTSGADPWGGVV